MTGVSWSVLFVVSVYLPVAVGYGLFVTMPLSFSGNKDIKVQWTLTWTAGVHLVFIYYCFFFSNFHWPATDQPLTRYWRNWIIAYPSPFEQLLPHLANFPFSCGTREQTYLPLKFWGFSNCRWKILSATVHYSLLVVLATISSISWLKALSMADV